MKLLRLCMALFAGLLLLTACAGEQTTALTPLPTEAEPAEAQQTDVAPQVQEPVVAAAAPQAERPRPVQPRAGGTYWVVYVMIAEPDSPDFAQGVEVARSLGVVTSPGHLGCDVGAHTTLGLPDWYEAVAVYFETKQQADTFIAVTGFQPIAILEVVASHECFN